MRERVRVPSEGVRQLVCERVGTWRGLRCDRVSEREREWLGKGKRISERGE